MVYRLAYMLGIGVVGYGYWGPNLVRNFTRLPTARVNWVCDLDTRLLSEIPRLYPTIRTTAKVTDLLKDPETQAIVIATPVSTHYTIAHQAIATGKHVLIEKPMTETSAQARKLLAEAQKKKKILMVDHTFVYTQAVQMMKKILSKGELGTLQYVDCVRTNLGLLQKDVNVMYDLAVHDFGILQYLLGENPLSVSATGIAPHDTGVEEVAHISLKYPKNVFVHSHVSWLSPVKIRQMIFVGTKKMLLYDDTQPSEKIKIYDKSVTISRDPSVIRNIRIDYRTGTTVAPYIPQAEGLARVSESFVSAIHTGRPPLTNGETGYQVVRILEYATKSMRDGGKTITL